jgi:DNA repair protein RecN (Recombination protein N)
MLHSLSVRNFILIDKLNIEFTQGFCVITGDTGSGKSLLLDALLFCLGGRFSSDVIKNNTDYAAVSAIFTLDDNVKNFLAEINIECDDELFIKRIQKPGNRKQFLVNDQLVTQKTIETISSYIFELHGQNSHSSLANPASHIDILDNYGDLLVLRADLSEHFKNIQSLESAIAEIAESKEKIENEIAYLSFVVAELSNANIKPGEEEGLSNIRLILQKSDKEKKQAQEILSKLEIPEIDQSINKALRIIARSGRNDAEWELISSDLEMSYSKLDEARIRLKSLISDFSITSYNLEEVEERLFEIRDKTRKYGISSDEVDEFLVKSSQKLESLTGKISSSDELIKSLEIGKKQYFELASILSARRLEVAKHLEGAVQKELEQLKMEKAIFKVDINADLQDRITRSGIDSVRFVASTNPGMSLAPIDKIASGGELSRFMLALKTSLFDKATTPLIIFDEIDTGIGGVVADAVGERLTKLSKIAQVLVITHQPQVAGKADQHLLVRKNQLDDNTIVTVDALENDARYLELARMISGKLITENSIKAAKELLRN